MGQGTGTTIRWENAAGVPPGTPTRRRVWLLLLTAWLGACAVAPVPPAGQPSAPAPSAGAAHTIFVTSNGWHSSIVLARTGLPPGRIPEAADFPGARFLEFGWGDAEYYPAKQTTVAMTLRAVLTPTPAVVHVAGLAVPPARRTPKAEVVPLSLDAERLGRLVGFIDATFERGGRHRAGALRDQPLLSGGGPFPPFQHLQHLDRARPGGGGFRSGRGRHDNRRGPDASGAPR